MLVISRRDWGTSLVAALVIPGTIAITFIAVRLLGESFDLMTLGGLALAFSRLIDDSVVVLEHIFRHMDLGESHRIAAEEGAR